MIERENLEEQEELVLDFDLFNGNNLKTIPFYDDSNIVKMLIDVVSVYKNDISLYRKHEEFKNIDIYICQDFIGFMYSAEAHFGRTWTDLEVICRPIIFDYTNAEIVCRGMNKFFNLGEVPVTQIDLINEWSLNPDYQLNVADKLDGSFVMVFKYKNKVYASTKHGLETPQAKWTAMHLKYNYSTDHIPESVTLFFEAIYKENYDGDNLIIKYPFEGIFLFGARYNYGGEFTYANLKLLSDQAAYQMVKFSNIPNFLSLVEQNALDKEKEGVVINIYDKEDRILRAKSKTSKYIKLKSLKKKIGFKLIKEKYLEYNTAYLYSLVGDIDELVLFIEDKLKKIDDIVGKKMSEIKSQWEEIKKQEKLFDFSYFNFDCASPEQIEGWRRAQKKDFANFILSNDDYKLNCGYYFMLYNNKGIEKVRAEIIDNITRKDLALSEEF